MFSIKKIIIIGVSVILGTFMLFVIADDSSTNLDNNLIKKIEISDYYGLTSLLVNLHLELGRGVSSEDGIFYVVDLLNQMKYYSSLDVLDYLSYSFDVERSLDSVMYDLSDMLEKTKMAQLNLKNNLTSLRQKKEVCDDSKKFTDKNFSLALKDLDSKGMELSLNKSLDYAKCALDARIYYNAQDKILDQLNFYYDILEKKYLYFESNRVEVINNYPEILYNLSK